MKISTLATIQHCMEYIAKAIIQEKETKVIQIEMERLLHIVHTFQNIIMHPIIMYKYFISIKTYIFILKC
jgi:hypothetical protein